MTTIKQILDRVDKKITGINEQRQKTLTDFADFETAMINAEIARHREEMERIHTLCEGLRERLEEGGVELASLRNLLIGDGYETPVGMPEPNVPAYLGNYTNGADHDAT